MSNPRLPADSRAKNRPEDLDGGVRVHHRRLHRGAEHPDHQRLAAQYPGRDRRWYRRWRLDLDRLSGRRDRRDPAHRVSDAGVLAAPLSAGQHDHVPGDVGGLCLRAEPEPDDRASRVAGLLRRRADPDGLYHHADHAAAVQAAGRAGDVRRVRHLRAGDRADDRRLPDRNLRLAVHLLRQPDTRRDHAGDTCGRRCGPRR